MPVTARGLVIWILVVVSGCTQSASDDPLFAAVSGATVGPTFSAKPSVHAWLQQQRWRKECRPEKAEEVGLDKLLVFKCAENARVRVYLTRECGPVKIASSGAAQASCSVHWSLKQVDENNGDNWATTLLRGEVVADAGK